MDKGLSYDTRVLNMINGGEDKKLCWGAAMSEAIEYLRKQGFIMGSCNITITEKGKEYLRKVKT